MALRERIKQFGCPFCHLIGALVLHGYLRGYHEQSSDRVVRGHRIYCSRRGRRCGCGRSFSALMAGFLSGFTICADSLWRFLSGISAGVEQVKALHGVLPGWAAASASRLWRRFSSCQPGIRQLLLRVVAAPPCATAEPVLQTIAHLRAAFPLAACPLSDFQMQFQTSLL